jgi:hypothetical protein
VTDPEDAHLPAVVTARDVVHEQSVARTHMRESAVARPSATPSPLADWQTQYVITQSRLVQGLRARQRSMTVAAQRLLIEGIQQHLLTLLERIVVAKGRTRRDPPTPVRHPRHPAIVWGPPVQELLAQENAEADRDARLYTQMATRSWLHQMMAFDAAKHPADAPTWWALDVSVFCLSKTSSSPHVDCFTETPRRIRVPVLGRALRRLRQTRHCTDGQPRPLCQKGTQVFQIHHRRGGIGREPHPPPPPTTRGRLLHHHGRSVAMASSTTIDYIDCRPP